MLATCASDQIFNVAELEKAMLKRNLTIVNCPAPQAIDTFSIPTIAPHASQVGYVGIYLDSCINTLTVVQVSIYLYGSIL